MERLATGIDPVVTPAPRLYAMPRPPAPELRLLHSGAVIPKTTRVALAQLNPTVNDFEGNQEKILDAIRRAKAEGADLVVTPELITVGYPAEDLLSRDGILPKNDAVVAAVRAAAREHSISVIMGCLEGNDGDGKKSLYNSAIFIGPDGTIQQTRRKSLLPTYGVFHEDRYFAEGSRENIQATTLEGVPCGVTICEEVWADKDYWSKTEYPFDPVQILAQQGVKVLINTSSSPYSTGKPGVREEMLKAMAQEHGMTIVYTNQVGGNTELVFDGNSMVISPDGEVVARAASWKEDLIFVDLDEAGVPTDAALPDKEWAPEYDGTTEDLDLIAPEVLEALKLGVKDYCAKTGFTKAIVGLSGGIDSAVTATIAVRALGAENVVGIGMPSDFSSEGSVSDAQKLAENLGIEFRVKPIEGIVDAFREAIGNVADVADENLQARARGTILMGISNRENRVLLTTGNKSELAVGYCTLYGDMCGGLAVISDCAKELVYAIARAINADEEVIPESTITKPASAELRPDQKDADSLPPYPVLDRIVHEYVVNNRSFEEIRALKLSLPETELARVLRMIDKNEFKRRQAAPGLRVTSRSFGRHDRWFPIAAKVS